MILRNPNHPVRNGFAFLLAVAAVLVFSTDGRAQQRPASSPTATPAPSTTPRERAETSRLDEALSTFFGILQRRSPGDTSIQKLDELYRRGLDLERAGRPRDAFRLYEQAMGLRVDDPRVHLGIGRIVENENPALALYHYQSAFRYAVEAAADQVPALEMLRRFLVGRYLQYALPVDQENPQVSAKLLELAESLAPEDPRIHAHLATAYFFSAQYERSVQESQNAIALGLEDGLIYTNIAATLAQLSRAAEAESYLVHALNMDELEINEVLNSVRRAEEMETRVTFGRLLGREKLDRLMQNSAKGLLESGIKAWRQGDTAAGLRFVQKACDNHPAHSYALIVLGDFKRSLGDTAGAKSAYVAALSRNARNQLALPRLGDITFADRDFVAAADYYKRAMDMMSGRIDRIDILDRTAVALAQQRKHDEALALLDKWLKANPDAPEFFELSVRRAGILSDAARHRDAEVVLRGLADRDKLNPAGYIVLHTFYKERGEDRKAQQVVNDGVVRLQAARDRDPLDPNHYRSLARLYRVLGNERLARQELLNGGLRTADKRYFSNELFASDAETEAYDVLKSWVTAEPGNAEAVLSWGWVAARLKRDLPNALAKVEEVAEVYGEEPQSPVRRTRGYLHYAMGNHEKAIADVRAVLSSDNVGQAAFFHRLWGASAEALGRKPEALEHLKRALALDPQANADLADRIAALEAPAPAAPAAPAGRR